ncbi:MAG: AAA family ATPase [Bacilli bacterium]
MIGAERGYYFQDYISAYLIINFIKKELQNSQKISFVLDKKENANDKYDDIKVFWDKVNNNYQIKYREKKGILNQGDLFNKSGDFNLRNFIISANDYNQECRLFISMNKINIDDNLSPFLEEISDSTLSLETKTYKFKNLIDQITNLNKDEEVKITENDIKHFEKIAKLELCELSLDEISEIVGKEIKNLVGNLTNDNETKLARILVDISRELRVNYELKEISIIFIITKLFSEIGISKYLFPIENKLIFENDIYVSRNDDVKKIIDILKTTNFLHIIGAPGVGKSWFTEELMDNLKDRNYEITKYYFYINNLENDDLNERVNYNRFITTLNFDLQKEKGLNINLINLKLEEIKNSITASKKQHCIILDGLDHIIREKGDSNKIILENLISELVKIFSESNVKILLLSQPLDLPITTKYEIKNFNINQVKSILEKYKTKIEIPKHLTPEKLLEISNGNPLIIKYEILNSVVTKDFSKENFKNLDDYYNYIFSGSEYHIYSYFGVLKFAVNIDELQQISKHNIDVVTNEIKNISNVLHKNEYNELSPFHESMKRFIKEKSELKFELESNNTNIFDWLKCQDLYSNRKAFTFFPSMTVELKKYQEFEVDISYSHFFEEIINNGYTRNSVENFCRLLSVIYLEKNDYENLYIISHTYDAYDNFMYEFDMETFEFYIYMLFFRNEKNKIINLINSKDNSTYSNQFREHAINISKFLMENNFNGIDFIFFLNQYTSDEISDDKENVYNFNGFIWHPNEGFSLLFTIFDFYNFSMDEALNYSGKKNDFLNKSIESFYKNNKNNYFIQSLYTKNLYAKKQSSTLKTIINDIDNFSEEVNENNYYDLIFKFLSLNKKDQKNLIQSWDTLFKIKKRFLHYSLSLYYVLTNNLENNDIDSILNPFISLDMQFSGLTVYNPRLECSLISKHINRDYIVYKLYQIINSQIPKYSFRDYNGIRPYLQSFKRYLIDYIIGFPKDSNIELADLLYTEYSENESNASNLIYALKNYSLFASTNNNPELIYLDVLNYMFTYGSYRDVQLWELEDFVDRLLDENMITKEMMQKMLIISLSATNIMDKAKDVHHIPGSILEKYGKKYPLQAIEILIENMKLFNGDVEDSDNLFTKMFEKIYTKEKGLFNQYYEYWKYLQNTNINGKNRFEKTLDLVNEFKRKKEQDFIINEFCDDLKSDIHPYPEEEIKKIKEALIIGNREFLKSFQEIDSTSYSNRKEYIDKNFSDIFELILDKEKNIEPQKLLQQQIELLSKTKAKELIDFFINADESYYNSDIVNSIIKITDEQIKKLDINVLTIYLVGIYYKTSGYISTMYYDETMNKAINLNKKYAQEILKMFIKEDIKYTPRMKSGKIFKYLVPQNKIINVFDIMINLYAYRLPNLERKLSNLDFSNLTQIELFFNYVLINTFYNTTFISLESFILIKIFKKYKINHILNVTGSNRHHYKDSGDYLFGLSYLFTTYGYLMYESFLSNYGEPLNYEFKVEYIPNDVRNIFNIKINDNKHLNLVKNNLPLLIFENISDVIKYKCTYQHYYRSGMDRDYINLNNRIFYLKKRNLLSIVYLRIMFRKLYKKGNE